MQESWLEIRLTVPSDGVDLVSQALMELGCAGVVQEERPLDTFVPPDPDADLPDSFALRAYFPPECEPEALIAQLTERLQWLARLVPGLSTEPPAWQRVAGQDWAENWKQHFSLQRFGRRLVVRPTWEDYQPAADEAVLVLDPGMAFGTGTHPTTRLCLQALSEISDRQLPTRVLDVGTGSGILAIAAALLGSPTVLGCDIEPEACRTAQANAQANGVARQVQISDAPLESLPGDFDLVLANILAEENIRLAPELLKRLAPEGALILSGILTEKEPAVIAAFNIPTLTGPEITREEEWSCLVYRRS